MYARHTLKIRSVWCAHMCESSLALLAGMVFMLHGVVFSTLNEVAPIESNLTSTEITLVIEPVTIPMQIMADAR